MQNGDVCVHVELSNTEIHVESAEVENGAEPTSALGGQEVTASTPTPTPGHATSRRSPPPPWLGLTKPVPTELPV